MSDDNRELAGRVAALARPIWNECYVGIISQEQIDYMVDKFQTEGAICNDLENGYMYRIVTAEGKDVGYCGYTIDGDSVYLSKIYVVRDYRKKGLGRKCLSFVEQYAKDNGKKRIHLRVNRNNVDSIRTYETWGFRTYQYDTADIGNGFVMDDNLMEKLL